MTKEMFEILGRMCAARGILDEWISKMLGDGELYGLVGALEDVQAWTKGALELLPDDDEEDEDDEE